MTCAAFAAFRIRNITTPRTDFRTTCRKHRYGPRTYNSEALLTAEQDHPRLSIRLMATWLRPVHVRFQPLTGTLVTSLYHR